MSIDRNYGPEKRPLNNRQLVNTFVLVGDSLTEYNNSTSSTISAFADNGDGTATATINVGAVVQVGDYVRVNNATATKYNTMRGLVTSIVANTSVTYQMTGTVSPVANSAGYFVYERYQSSNGWFVNANVLSGQRYSLLYNLGIGGITSDQLYPLLAEFILPRMPRFVACMLGMNDIYALDYTLNQIKTYQRKIFDWIVDNGMTPVIFTCPPRNSGSAGWTAAKLAKHLQMVDWQKSIARELGCPLVDSWRAHDGTGTYASPTDAEADPSTTYAPDGIHPGNVGGYALGNEFHRVISPLIPANPVFTTVTAQNYTAGQITAGPGSILDNPTLTGTGGTKTAGSGTCTGNVADSWTVEIESGTATVTCSKVARTLADDGDLAGDWQRMAITNASGTSIVVFRTADIDSRVTNGDELQGGGLVRLTSEGSPGSGNPSATTGLECRVLMQTATTSNKLAYDMATVASPVALRQGFSGAMLTPITEVRTPSATHGAPSNVRLTFAVTLTGSASCTLDVACPVFQKNVTA